MTLIYNITKRLFVLLIIYTSSRVFFYLNNQNNFYNTNVFDFVEAIRFDISALIYINIPLFLLLLIPQNLWNNKIKNLINIIFYLINIPFIILNNIDIEYFRFTQKRSTIDFIYLIALGEDAKNTIPQYLKDYWLIGVFTIIQCFLLIKYTKLEMFERSKKMKHFILLLTTIVFMIFGARGGSQLKPIKPINAGDLSNSVNYALILNTPFCFIHSIYDEPLKKYNYFDKNKLQNIYSPIHFAQNSNFTKKNVVILIMECFSKEFIGFYNSGRGYTPFLDSLMKNSLVFENAYSNGLKSIEALPAISASIPGLIENPFITSNYSQNNINSIASILNKEGYNTSFFHGGVRGTMGFYSFCKKAGFKNYFGMEEFNDKTQYDGTWGIYDLPFLEYKVKKINAMKEPFLSMFFSLSSHPPYSIPKSYIENNFKKGQKIGMFESIQYSDHALKHFFEIAKKEKWFKNTIFIITADHTSPVSTNKKYQNKIGRYSIPMIIYNADNLKNEKNYNIVQQIDIMPTILDILNYDKSFFSFGKSMFKDDNWAVFYNQRGYYLITKNGFIKNKAENYASFSDWRLRKRKKIKQNDINLLKGIKQTFNNRMIDNKLLYEN